MFPGGGGMPDMGELLQQAQQMQQQLAVAQAELAEAEVEGSSGGGLVTAKLRGNGELISLDIKPEAVDPSDTETLADLVVAAIRDAAANAQALTRQKLGPLAGALGGGAGGGMPGMPDLSDIPGLGGGPAGPSGGPSGPTGPAGGGSGPAGF